MRKITGNKLLVRALKEEGVDTIFGYPGACTIDISDELYKQDDIRVILPRHEQALVHEAERWVSALLRAVRELPIWSQGLRQPTMTVSLLYVLPDRWQST